MATPLPPTPSASSTATPAAVPSASSLLHESSSTVPVSIHAAEASQQADADPQTDHDDSEGSRTVAVPRCSTWFAMDKINPIEKRMLPEFFTANAARSAELYLKYRNYMVHAYRQQPGVYLTATACRRNLAGDACAILRVHEFLTHWGLINFHVPPHAMPPAVHPTYALKTAEQTTLRPEMGPVATIVAATKASGRRATVPLACDVCGTARESDVSFFELTPEAKTRVMCNGAIATSGNATPVASNAVGKTSDKEVTLGGVALRPGSGICEHCFLGGAFPDGYDASDFVLTPSSVSSASVWTSEETTALLEAVSDTRQDQDASCDWNVVATKVATKTAQECLLHFLELPMFESITEATQSLKLYTPGEALNTPVLDLLTLVEQVDPLVAKAAAYAAITATQRLHSMPIADPVKTERGSGGFSSRTVLESAADAVATSSQTAGIAVPIKSEDGAEGRDGDKETRALDSANASGGGTIVTKELIAVTEEAANATTVALVAARAHQLAEDTATGPIRELVHQLLENQVRQMELKMLQLDVLEQTIAAEREQVAREKYRLYVDRLAFAQDKLNDRMA